MPDCGLRFSSRPGPFPRHPAPPFRQPERSLQRRSALQLRFEREAPITALLEKRLPLRRSGSEDQPPSLSHPCRNEAQQAPVEQIMRAPSILILGLSTLSLSAPRSGPGESRDPAVQRLRRSPGRQRRRPGDGQEGGADRGAHGRRLHSADRRPSRRHLQFLRGRRRPPPRRGDRRRDGARRTCPLATRPPVTTPDPLLVTLFLDNFQLRRADRARILDDLEERRHLAGRRRDELSRGHGGPRPAPAQRDHPRPGGRENGARRHRREPGARRRGRTFLVLDPVEHPGHLRSLRIGARTASPVSMSGARCSGCGRAIPNRSCSGRRERRQVSRISFGSSTASRAARR